MMSRFRRIFKMASLVLTGVVLLGASGSCVPDNLWADLWGISIITGAVEGVRNTLLVNAGLQTP